jgi:hypothetical protein
MSLNQYIAAHRYYLEGQYYSWLSVPPAERGTWWDKHNIDSFEAYARYEYNLECRQRMDIF